jgi:hypothetical protein
MANVLIGTAQLANLSGDPRTRLQLGEHTVLVARKLGDVLALRDGMREGRGAAWPLTGSEPS